jgi:transposase-like protein
MKLSELLIIVQDEKKSEDYLRSVGILKTFSNCPRCGSTSLTMIRGNRWVCNSCKTEWTRRKDSILSLVRIKYSEFLLCLKLFELELTAKDTADQLKINYKTVLLLFRYFRVIISGYRKFPTNVERKILASKSEKIGINYEDGQFHFDFENNNPQNIASIEFERSRVSNSAVIFDMSIDILSTMNTKHLFKQPPHFQIFLRYVKEKLFKFRGTDEKYLFQYLKEIEFRFNNDRMDIYDCLSTLISKNF